MDEPILAYLNFFSYPLIFSWIAHDVTGHPRILLMNKLRNQYENPQNL